jgi:hypothetical protein
MRQRHVPSVPPTIRYGGCDGCLPKGVHDAREMGRLPKRRARLTMAPFPASLLFKFWRHLVPGAQPTSSSVSILFPERHPTMSSLGSGSLGVGGEGASERRGPGCPKGSGTKPASPAAVPLTSRKRGRPKGSRNQKTLAALAATAVATSAAATSVGAAPAAGGEGVPAK